MFLCMLVTAGTTATAAAAICSSRHAYHHSVGRGGSFLFLSHSFYLLPLPDIIEKTKLGLTYVLKFQHKQDLIQQVFINIVEIRVLPCTENGMISRMRQVPASAPTTTSCVLAVVRGGCSSLPNSCQLVFNSRASESM